MAELVKENIQGAFLGETPVIALYHGDVQIWAAATSAVFTSSGDFAVPSGIKSMTVTVIGAGGHGGAGGGLTMWGGTGGIGGLVVKIFEGAELKNLPNSININVGICPDSTGAAGQNSSFNNEVIAYGGGGGGNGGFGYNGANGYNGSGIGGDVTVGSPAADRTYDGIVYGAGGGGTQGGGGGYPGAQGVVVIEWTY